MEEEEDENVTRGNWSSKIDFILSCLGYTVGLGNVWRFPYLAYSYGGAIFLIPYAISLLLIGIPMFFLELSLGQFTSSGPLTCWRMAPIAQGIGAAMLVVSSVLAVYYNMIIAWALHYLIASFTALPTVPWRYCNPKWATLFCSDYVWSNISESARNCSKAIGYDSTAGNYIPFHNGLCIGMLSSETDENNTWFADSTSSSEEAFIYNGGYRTWATNATSQKIFHPSFIEPHSYPIDGSDFTKGLVGFWNVSLANKHGYKRIGPASEYFTRQVLRLHLSSGMADLGAVHWDLALALLAAWLFVFFSLIKGIKSSGKVVYFTAIFPYVLLLTLLIRGALLKGAMEGVLYYVRGYGAHPQVIPEDIMGFYAKKLANIDVWKKAAEQTFFSLSTCYGGLITLASYNRFKNNVVRDTLIITLGDALTSFFAGFVVFSFLGALAENLGVEVSEVTDSGIGLAFVVYPEAVTHIQPTVIWAVLFFIMVLTLGLDSEFGLIETILTAVMDIMPSLRPKRTMVITVLCLLFYLIGLTMCTSGGFYVLILLDTFGSGWNVLLIAVLECFTVAWIYSIIPQLMGSRGASSRFVDDVQTMLGSSAIFHIPWIYFKWLWIAMWSVITPFLCLMLMIGSLVEYGQTAALQHGDYVYETGFVILGWFITVLVVSVIILGAGAALVQSEGKFIRAFKPTRLWGPALDVHRKLCAHLTELHKQRSTFMNEEPEDEEFDELFKEEISQKPSKSKSISREPSNRRAPSLSREPSLIKNSSRLHAEQSLEKDASLEKQESLTRNVIGFRPASAEERLGTHRSYHSRKTTRSGAKKSKHSKRSKSKKRDRS